MCLDRRGWRDPLQPHLTKKPSPLLVEWAGFRFELQAPGGLQQIVTTRRGGQTERMAQLLRLGRLAQHAGDQGDTGEARVVHPPPPRESGVAACRPCIPTPGIAK